VLVEIDISPLSVIIGQQDADFTIDVPFQMRIIARFEWSVWPNGCPSDAANDAENFLGEKDDGADFGEVFNELVAWACEPYLHLDVQ